jgi:hypothetical protein
VGLLDARFRPHDSMLLHLGEFQLENVVSFLAGASVALRGGVVDDKSSVGAALKASEARGAIVSREFIRQYYDTIAELERTPYGKSYNFVDFPKVKMMLQTGRDPVPGFYTYESTFVSGAMPDPIPVIVKQLSGDSEVAFSFGGKKNTFSHADLIKV